MHRHSLRSWLGTSLLALLVLPWVILDALSQAPPGQAQGNPQAPNLAMPVPLGIQRGTSLELTLTGTNLAEPTGMWTTMPAAITIPTDNNNGKDNSKLRVQVAVPKDAPLGFHPLRLATARGISNLRLFCVDDLPQIMETDNNRAKTTPQSLPIPCVVVGRADVEASDYFKITVKPGQRVSFEILGRRLGSAFDPQISLFDPRSGRELPGGHSNDAPGLQTDARLTYTFKEGGDYLIEVRDVMYRGGPDFWYRLRIGDFPCATCPIPMAVRRGTQATITFAGTQVEGIAPLQVFVPSELSASTLWVSPRGPNGIHGWPVALAVTDSDEIVEQEPNDDPSKANRIAAPVGITGRFHESGDVDHYVFSAKKGERLIIEAQTHELASPTEVYMVVRDAKGAQVAASNPAQAPRVDFTAPADGDFTLALEHLLYWGGPTEVYHLTVVPYSPGFDVSLALDRYEVPQGSVTAIPIVVTRRDYPGPIELTANGPPGISGRAILRSASPAAEKAAKAGAPPPPAGLLFLEAGPDTPLSPGTVTIQARAVINGKNVVSYANARTAVSTALGALPYPPRQLIDQIGFAVTEKPPFTLSARLDQAEAIRGNPANVTIQVRRDKGFAEEIALSTLGLPPNVTSTAKSIAKGQNEVKAQLTAAAGATLGEHPIGFSGKAKHQGKEFTAGVMPVTLTLVVPFELSVEPAQLKLANGSKATLKVSALRRGGLQTPIKLQVRNLPANVTAAETTLALDQTSADIEVTAAANALTADKADVSVLGNIESPTKDQVASANIAVSVQGLPFELSIEPATIKIPQGGKAKLKVTAKRAGYQGPIELQLRNLPEMVSAGMVSIPMGQNSAEIEVIVDEKTEAGEKKDVNVLGLATAAENKQNASPNFTVAVEKKK